MKKQIFITNGMARCGKDTFAIFLNGCVNTYKVSSIDIIKKIAEFCGWDGGKTEKDRKFLSDLKVLTSEYSDLAFKYVSGCVEEFLEDEYYSVMVIDIREPEEIKKAVEAFGAKTVLIKNDNAPKIESNMADAGVFDYEYDIILENNGTLDEFREAVKRFVDDYVDID